MAGQDGDGWARCERGHMHWGRFGAVGLLAYAGPEAACPEPAGRELTGPEAAGPEAAGPEAAGPEAAGPEAAGREAAWREAADPESAGPGAAAGGVRVLLARRSRWGQHGGTWGPPGGARDSDEPPVAAALREAAEECGLPPGEVDVQGMLRDDHGGWSYQTYVAAARALFPARAASPEITAARWVDVARVPSLRLHGQLASLAERGVAGLPGLLGLPPLDRWFPGLVLVVEGAARRAAFPSSDHVRVVLAPGSGDDAIVAEARALAGRRLVVTADRELRRRCEAAGASATGPGWLLALL